MIESGVFMATPVVRSQLFTELLPPAATSHSSQTNHRANIQSALQRVLSCAAFRSSKRSRDFLQYVVEQSLSGRPEYLKERSIGAALFARSPDYDTGTDAIVRVTASDVRKRLSLYYSSEGTEESLIFHLAAGSYLPTIRILSPPLPHDEIVTAPAASSEPRIRSFRWLAWAGWTAALLVTALWVGSVLSRPDTNRPISRLPWNGIFSPGKTPEIILADGAMGALRALRSFPLTFENYADRSFLLPGTTLLPEMRNTWSDFTHKQFTSLADARVLAAISQMAGTAGRNIVVRYARDLQLSDFRRGSNMVLLGSHLSNPWVDLFSDRLHFQIATDPLNKQEMIQVRNRKNGDPHGLSSPVRSGSTGQAYAVLAYLKGLGDNGHVLILQGTNMEGTDLAGALSLDQPNLSAALRSCNLDTSVPDAHFELLLELNSTAGSIRSSKVVSRYCAPSP